MGGRGHKSHQKRIWSIMDGLQIKLNHKLQFTISSICRFALNHQYIPRSNIDCPYATILIVSNVDIFNLEFNAALNSAKMNSFQPFDVLCNKDYAPETLISPKG